MKTNLSPQIPSAADSRRSVNRLAACLMLGMLLHAANLFSVRAGTFVSDFNAGLPNGSTVFGNATNDLVGGFTNSGTIKLTTATASQNGSFIITNDLDAGQPVVSFTASFKTLIGGGNAADGLSFNFASDLPLGTISEAGAGTGITVSFDTFSNDAGDPAPSISVFVGGALNQEFAIPLRLNAFVDTVVQLNPDGTLDVIYDGTYAISNLVVGNLNITGGLFGFGARTGGQNDNHFIDDLSITTHTSAAPFVQSFAPRGRVVRADAPIKIILTDNTTAVDTTKLVLKLDDAIVTPTVTQSAPDTTISYVPPALFASGSSHSVSLVFVDNASPTPKTNTWNYQFTVAPYSTLNPSLAASLALVDTNSPGFTVRFSQLEDNTLPGNLARADAQLAGLIIDTSTGLLHTNIANPDGVAQPANIVSTNASSYTYLETNVINYATGGNFADDLILPGIPGTTGNSHNYALDAVAYLHLTPGFYNLGVNSADGFKLTAASTPDIFASVQSVFDGPRLTPADTTVAFTVTQEGYYPFRLLYLIGQQTVFGVPNPGTDTPSLEFFNVDADGIKTLVNDATVAGSVSAFRGTATLPYVQSVTPQIGETAVSRSTSIDIVLADGTIAVQTNSIALRLNGADVTNASAISADESGRTTVHYQPPALLAVNTSYTVEIAFTDANATRRTNSYQFSTENILSQMWVIPPASTANATWAKWLTTGSTERGIAYNPKTGHVLIVSRGAATGADGPGGAGIGVFDGNTGQFIKQLDKGTGIIAGGTFIVNMVDVAEDGAIYVCSLATSATSPFKIYRWQDEDSQPTIAFNGFPTATAGAPRWGDSFAVRGSGAGTQIIASGNNASANSVPLFTTSDGINYSVTLLVPTGMPNSAARLGIAFGCGNTLYAKDNAATALLRQVSFVGAPSTAASLAASYSIVNALGNQGIGPIGVDIVNQRLMGDTTIGGTVPHSLSLFDLDQLSTSGVNNPIDSKPYATSTGSFGTGAVDFSPDGTRVYALDTGNGVIAFSLAPKVAAPNICAQPQNHLVAGPGELGFMDVMAIGAPQRFQWRFNGVPIANATNRTLDISDVQPAKLGYYSVVITNATVGLSVTSSPAYLDTQMVFTNEPASQVVAIGGTANFEAGVSNGLPAYTYQWQLNGTNIAGATTSALTVNNAQVANAGGYTVVITDSLGQALTSQVASLTVGTLGTGTGLTGDYYSSQLETFTGPPTLTRVDSTVDFDFLLDSPDGSISIDTFTVRWSGQVQPLYSQTYTFSTTTDDGVRLWVNGQLVINSWINQAPTERSGSIALTANQKYDILIEYFENTGGAVARLGWSSLGQVKGIIPQTQLYPGVSPVQPALSSSLNNGTSLILNWGGTFQLESATNVAGPYSQVAGITNSPYTNIIGSEPEMYFRLLNQY